MGTEIRRLTIDDYDEILRVWAEAGLPFKLQGRDHRDRIAVEMQRTETGFFGLLEDGRMLAVGLACFDGRKGWIQRVAVDPDRRGEGLGGKIITGCEEFLGELGAEVISCLIEDLNTPSMSLFRKADYECWTDILYFSKRTSSDS